MVKKLKPRSLRVLDGLLNKAKNQKEYNAVRNSFTDAENDSWFERETDENYRAFGRVTKQIRRAIQEELNQANKRPHFCQDLFLEFMANEVRENGGDMIVKEWFE